MRVPAVVQYAHKLAFLVGQHIHEVPKVEMGESGSLYFLWSELLSVVFYREVFFKNLRFRFYNVSSFIVWVSHSFPLLDDEKVEARNKERIIWLWNFPLPLRMLNSEMGMWKKRRSKKCEKMFWTVKLKKM